MKVEVTILITIKDLMKILVIFNDDIDDDIGDDIDAEDVRLMLEVVILIVDI